MGITVVKQDEGRRQCLDRKGRPMCGAKAAGSFLVDRLIHVTCQACLAITNLPMTRLVRPGES